MSRPASRVIPIAPVSDDTGEMVSLYAKQATIHARSVHGWFAAWRWALVWLTQLVFYGLPWLPWNGRPAVLFDLGARRFYIFDLVLYPQDFIYLTGLLILSAYGLFLFTAVAGRLWCGYACPQTVYTEIFMWVEHHIEGDRQARLKLDAAPWGAAKLARRSAKHAVWLAIGLWTGFTFVGYFTPIRELGGEVLALIGLAGPGSAGPGPWEAFWVLFYGFATYGNAGFMREQVCKYMCPYARFQSAMFDHDTLIISYDGGRGEPRGSRPRSLAHDALAAQGKGDCIDCTLCVQVCPTGIDIREGLQYECIGCAACIDVCNGVMDKMAYPRGLIRYATQNGLTAGQSRLDWRRVFRPRVLVYGVILLLISVGFVTSLVLRSPMRVDVVRDRGTLARLVDEGRIENVYRLQIMNATESEQRYRVVVSGIAGAQAQVRDEVRLAPAESRWVPVAVQVPPQSAAALGPGAHPLRFEIIREADGMQPAASVSEKSTFVVPR
ncbi:cytochrome c oxidase accessory protein CcoG [Methylibium petroleiphilum]|uniref:Putative iron-sulfur 4Fe-4S ferredoxin transmembrane protein n=1 Tax=Methylibium petroleiphilum (strain ATCC BAA-1232 / LMG 22953 / PM1) TaxID=420662 RepID=A2SIP0_METPP|nr:cytochrome c oxidase accessory protein CcoG [Methylibium petroleiphilum]ABM95429.1 putative iron-sulfur 4Fe-4S ferredoxin transmembrane protein [Methylibium petroleiphilum PM1]